METTQTRETQAFNALTISSAFLNTDKAILYLSTFSPTPNSVLADFTANRVLAADVADVLTTTGWSSGVDITGEALLIYGNLLKFIPAGTATFPIIAGGVYISDTGSTTLKGYVQFDNAITFNTLLDTLFVKPSEFFNVLMDADAEFISGP